MPLILSENTPEGLVRLFGSLAIVLKEETEIPVFGVGHEGLSTTPPATEKKPGTNEGHDGFGWS